MPLAVADQLRLRSIDAVTARDLDALGDSDEAHLARATALGRVLCTYDYDFVRLAAAGHEHAGIVIGQRSKHRIGDWVKQLERLCTVYSPEELKNSVQYLL